MSALFTRYPWLARGLVAGGVIVTGLGGAAVYMTATTPKAAGQSPAAKTEAPAKMVRLEDRRIRVPEELARNMRIKTAEVAAANHPVPLPALQGCLALDNNSLARVHSRFPGEVVALGTTTEAAEPSLSSQPPVAKVRPLRFGDSVRQGDLLAVVWSKDLGEKKSELVDAVSKLEADEQALARVTELQRQGASPERSLREAERTVQSDRVAVERAERTLKSWRLTAEEIAAVRAEAGRLNKADAKRTECDHWARVEVRATQDGVLLEKNVSVGDIVDTTGDLYKIGDLSHLVVWAHAFEDDLPMLQSLPKPMHWSVNLPSRPGASFSGTLEQIGAVIDPNQHTALVTGRVENPKGELRIGQFVTVRLSLPPTSGELELPVDAVTEDGRESVVFVQQAGKPTEYVRQTVHVTRRFRETIHVRCEGSGLKVGDHIVTTGSLLLRDAYEQLPKPTE
ncbi:efflux RND transporter periplasmic adaptor subunit [Zavarzinella formosa]|uniref:efflux RND transporter periplasmic adaptor subunit n=1 Tax=Zavarzinella formosa TaxID=360055 RepID=UPI000306BBFD|nr:efflux RND transporter periplasmic adaptor subunit [Zavarzinella formosa]